MEFVICRGFKIMKVTNIEIKMFQVEVLLTEFNFRNERSL